MLRRCLGDHERAKKHLSLAKQESNWLMYDELITDHRNFGHHAGNFQLWDFNKQILNPE